MPDETRQPELEALHDRVLADWQARLTSRWQPQARLLRHTPVELCDAFLQLDGERGAVASSEADAHARARQYFADTLWPRLLDAERVEHRQRGQCCEVRLRPAEPARPKPGDGKTNQQAPPVGHEPPAWDDERHYHALARLLPRLPDADYQALKEDIQQHGQQQPILTYQGQVVDGRCRHRACVELGLAPRTEEWDGQGTLLERVLSLNLKRRHLNESQRAQVAADLVPLYAPAAQERMTAGQAIDPGVNLPEGRARLRAAESMQVSERSVGSALQVSNAGNPKLVQAVKDGTVKVSAAAQLTALPVAEQDALLDQGAAAVREKAKQLRAGKKPSNGRHQASPPPRAPLTLKPNAAAPAVAAKLVQFFGLSQVAAICAALNRLVETASTEPPPLDRSSVDARRQGQRGSSSKNKT
ncbi:MAG: ParB N-terminal domain-containing protein [Planctomycetia bacterium]|nr:ParB N-terminal domain-containing protein [Planctomycetia bacterium]